MKKRIQAIVLALALILTMGGIPVQAGAEFSDGSVVQEPGSADLFAQEDSGMIQEDQGLVQEEMQNSEVIQEEAETYSAAAGSGQINPKADAAQSFYCKGYKKGYLLAGAKFPKKVKSSNNYYYLVKVNPITGKILGSAGAKAVKSTNVRFQVNISGKPELAVARYCIAVYANGKYVRVSPIRYLTNPEKMASNTKAYAVGGSKKGLQTTDISQIVSTNSKHIFVNIPMSVVVNRSPETVPYKYNGRTYYFSNIGGYQSLVRQCNQKKIVVTAQLLLDWCDSSLIAPEARVAGHSFYTWNTRQYLPREKMEALFSFMAEMFGKSDCYISNWILGNEVNSCQYWNYAGSMSKSAFITVYSEAFRSLYNAVRSQAANSKVFICLDHCWSFAQAGYSAKDFMDSFAKKIKSLQSGVQWNVAYHAYPSPLTNAAFWTNTNTTNSLSTPVINMKNLSVLTDYVKNTYGKKTRVLLSEQGFTSAQGQAKQAAAISLAYYIAACNPMVDGFIIRSYVDEPIEVAQGLSMGIKGKAAFSVFKYMDSSKTFQYTNKYLPVIGINSWKQMVPNYSSARLTKTYRAE